MCLIACWLAFHSMIRLSLYDSSPPLGHMKRRQFVTLLSGAAMWPLVASAQQLDQVHRVGVLSNIGESDLEAQSMVTALHEELRKLGWMDGRNLQVDHRWAAGNPDRATTMAKQLVALKPEVLVGHTTPSVIALRKQTEVIPIVFVQISDPIGAGFITNLARPDGNITGFTNFESSMVGKWVEMLKEMAPGVSRVAFLFNPQTAPYVARYYQGPLEASARSLGLQSLASPVHDAREIESAIFAFGHEPGGGLIVMPDSFNIVHRSQIMALAAQHRLPIISPYRFMVEEGGLMAYGVEPVELFRRAAVYVDRILKGAKPAELPVQAPTKFELVINLKAVKALGLSVPSTLLARADEVIE
jgi:putative tryptophan/tyrosine transport system substrate-binding protein